MSAPWEGLRPAGAPSEAQLDTFVTGEADPAVVATVEAWMDRDPAHRATVEARRSGFAALPVNAQRLRARVLLALEAQGPKSAPRPAWRWWPTLSVLATAAALLLFIAPAPAPHPGDLVAKGGAKLRVFGEAGELLSGAEVSPGTRLRFVAADVDPLAHLMVAGAEADDRLFAYAPAGGSGSLPANLRGPDGALPGAARLDESKGLEHAWLVACERPFRLAELGPAVGSKLFVPAGCTTAGFELRKR